MVTERERRLALLYRVANGCKERADALSLKGRRRDDMALHYFCGAGTAHGHQGRENPFAAHCFLMQTRGFSIVQRILDDSEIGQAAANVLKEDSATR